MTFPVREDGESELTPASLSQLYTHFRRKVHLKYIEYYQDYSRFSFKLVLHYPVS
jgi:hypothetical protein